MSLKDSITILYTRPKTYAEEVARRELLQRVYGNTNPVFANKGTTQIQGRGDAIVQIVTVKD